MVKIKQCQHYAVQLLVECIGTCIMIVFGEACIANYKFARQTSSFTLPVSISFGVGVYVAIIICAPITGAHLNPAVSIAFLTIRKIKPVQCVYYIVGQILGAFSGAALVYLVYCKQFDAFDGGQRQITGPNGTADIFFTMPSNDLPHWNTFIDQVVSTGLLMIVIMALTPDFNQMISEVTKPFTFVLVIVALTNAFSINAGGAFNPARDLGPRLFSSFIYGFNDVFRAHNYFFWVPILGPIVGSILAVWIYKGLIWIIVHHGDLSHITPINNTKAVDSTIIQTSYSNHLYDRFHKESTDNSGET